MTRALRLLSVQAVCGDEVLDAGETLAHYTREGIGVYLLIVLLTGVTSGKLSRSSQLFTAARALGVRGVRWFPARDKVVDLQDADWEVAATAVIARVLRQIRPQVVLAPNPESSADPCRQVVGRCTLAALQFAADPGFDRAAEWPPHLVARLFFHIHPLRPEATAFQCATSPAPSSESDDFFAGLR